MEYLSNSDQIPKLSLGFILLCFPTTHSAKLREVSLGFILLCFPTTHSANLRETTTLSRPPGIIQTCHRFFIKPLTLNDNLVFLSFLKIFSAANPGRQFMGVFLKRTKSDFDCGGLSALWLSWHEGLSLSQENIHGNLNP